MFVSAAVVVVFTLNLVAPAFSQEYSDDYNSPYQQNLRRQEYAAGERERQRQHGESDSGNAIGDALGWMIILGFACAAFCPRDSASNGEGSPRAGDKGSSRRPSRAPEPTFRVISVPSWDVLNMRSGPGERHDLVGEIPYRGSGIVVDRCVRNSAGTPWCVANYRGRTGWVSARYITPEG